MILTFFSWYLRLCRLIYWYDINRILVVLPERCVGFLFIYLHTERLFICISDVMVFLGFFCWFLLGVMCFGTWINRGTTGFNVDAGLWYSGIDIIFLNIYNSSFSASVCYVPNNINGGSGGISSMCVKYIVSCAATSAEDNVGIENLFWNKSSISDICTTLVIGIQKRLNL